jgi:hypothetical protein
MPNARRAHLALDSDVAAWDCRFSAVGLKNKIHLALILFLTAIPDEASSMQTDPPKSPIAGYALVSPALECHWSNNQPIHMQSSR